jgi:2-C-methyl-D-erythritol 4-phosphate cytidylyltransferase
VSAADVWVIVVAAGSGSRFGGPKQLEALGSERVLDRSVSVALGASDGVVVVVAPDQVDAMAADPLVGGRGVTVVAGADSRSGSVRAGLAAVPPRAGVVLVHDAARPLATPALYAAVIDAVRDGADAAVPAVAVTDTIRRRGAGVVDRSELVAVQTPQGFRAAALRAAHEGNPEATDDATLVEDLGGKVVLVPGETTNLKITTPSDLIVARALAER